MNTDNIQENNSKKEIKSKSKVKNDEESLKVTKKNLEKETQTILSDLICYLTDEDSDYELESNSSDVSIGNLSLESISEDELLDIQKETNRIIKGE